MSKSFLNDTHFSIKALNWTLNAFLKRKLLNWSQKSF